MQAAGVTRAALDPPPAGRYRSRLMRPALLLVLVFLAGCRAAATLAPPGGGVEVDRRDVEFPSGLALEIALDRLRGPVDVAFVPDSATDAALHGALVVAEGGFGGEEPRLVGHAVGGEQFEIYPRDRPWWQRLFGTSEQRLWGPVGGVAAAGDEVFVTHRDADGRGVVSAVSLADGRVRTVVADLPAQGDFGMSDVAVHPTSGRLYFGVGAATNSGVVGLDNWRRGWVGENPEFRDTPAVDLRLLGYRFDTRNPAGGWFRGRDVAVTGPFQPFGQSAQRIAAAATGKPTAALFSVSPAGGDLRVEAHGVRRPVGVAFNDFGNLYATNRGAALRGTRPVANDPDALLRVPLGGPAGGTWFGWPDYSASLRPLSDPSFQPPTELIAQSGYPELTTLVDAETSGLLPPDAQTLLRAEFDPDAGAARLDFPPDTEVFAAYRDDVLVALAQESRVASVEPDRRLARPFVFNTRGGRASEGDRPGDAMERPVSVVAGPDGSVYLVDQGEVRIKDGNVIPLGRTGKIYRLLAPPPVTPATRPAGPP